MEPSDQLPNSGTQNPQRRRLSRRATFLGSVVAIALLLGTGWLAWRLTHPAESGPGAAGGRAGGRGTPATTVGVATAETASIPVQLDGLGTVTPQASVKVRPQVSGVLEKVLFKEGQMVRAGDLLATIDARPFELALLQASGQRQRDEAQLDSARVTLTRFKTLLAQDSIARQEVDSQEALVKQLEGTVVIDKSNEGVARLNLAYTRVVAPISGRLGLRSVDVGNVVSSSDTGGIVLIAQLSPIDVVFSIPQDQIGEVQKNLAARLPMQVTALDRTRSSTLETGVLASLDNQVDVQTGTVKAKARFANSGLALFPNQFVNVQLLVTRLENAVVVPVTALRHGSTGDYVYVLDKEQPVVKLRPVQRGMATVDKIVITDGLQAGERVITEGADRLKDGARVALPVEAPADASSAGRGEKKRNRPAKNQAPASP
jgi:multidrug efflux system membrane fusion protein